MRRNTLQIWVVVLACTSLLTAMAIADDDNEPGGDIQGTEQLDQEIVLTATTNAPAGATGQAELEAEDEDGTTTATLDVETKGLAAGTYTVSITKKSDGSTIILGTFDVSSSETNDMEDGDSQGQDSQGDNDNQDEADVEFGGEAGLPLPDGLNPMDVATVAIADADGNVVLTGDFTAVATTMKSVFNANVAVSAGSAAPSAWGHAVVHSRVKKGIARNKFLLVAHGVTPNTVYTVNVNGAAVGTISSDRHGKVMMKSLPGSVNPSSLVSVELLDSGINVALSVSF